MKQLEAENRSRLTAELLAVWESSVRATHFFLSDAEIRKIRNYVPQAIESVEHLIIAETEKPIAFMGVQNGRLEMLFLTPEERGKGIGKRCQKDDGSLQWKTEIISGCDGGGSEESRCFPTVVGKSLQRILRGLALV